MISPVGHRDEAGGRRVGALAEAAGLTVRTLHHYEAIGLLVASGRSEGGHRLYAPADVERLYRICLLRQLGLPLEEIGRALDDEAWDLRSTVTAHLADLAARTETAGRLSARLTRLLGALGHETRPPVEDLLDLIEGMTTMTTTVQRRISILVYADIEAAHDFLVRVFDLGAGELTRDETGIVVHGEVHAGDGVIWLHQESPAFGLSSPRSAGTSTATTAVMVDDVDAHHAHAVEQGATIEYEPVDQPYGYREYSARDAEGGLWSFMKPLG